MNSKPGKISGFAAVGDNINRQRAGALVTYIFLNW